MTTVACKVDRETDKRALYYDDAVSVWETVTSASQNFDKKFYKIKTKHHNIALALMWEYNKFWYLILKLKELFLNKHYSIDDIIEIAQEVSEKNLWDREVLIGAIILDEDADRCFVIDEYYAFELDRDREYLNWSSYFSYIKQDELAKFESKLLCSVIWDKHSLLPVKKYMNWEEKILNVPWFFEFYYWDNPLDN